MKEAELRDRLVADPTVLWPGLSLVAKERYIPNDLGTRSFVDLYAQDEQGNHVLIELKRSNSSAREAIHEIYKYVEGVKSHLGARDNEIIVIVASTEWRELLVPFSRFVGETEITVRGLQLSFAKQTGELSAALVPLLPTSQGRFIAPWHEVHWYCTHEDMHRGIKTVHASLDAKGIGDYVVLLLRPPVPISSEHETAMVATLSALGESQGLSINTEAGVVPQYERAIYVAMQMLTEDQYLQLLKSFPEAYEEVVEYLSDDSDEERILDLHEALGAVEPRPESAHLEIGYPAKLSKFLDVQGFCVDEVVRRGIFQRNKVLTDDAIISELRGEDGSTGQRFKRSIDLCNAAHVAAARREIASCLNENPAWRSHVLQALNEVEQDYPNARLDISIYNPQAGMFTIFLTATREDGPLFVPTYSMIVHNPEPIRMYYGALKAVERTAEFRQILKKYYDNDLGQLMFTMIWGGRDHRDVDLLEDAGAVYRSFRCDIEANDAQQFFILRDGRWREYERVDAISMWTKYLEENEDFVYEIVQKIAACYHGGHFDIMALPQFEWVR